MRNLFVIAQPSQYLQARELRMENDHNDLVALHSNNTVSNKQLMNLIDSAEWKSLTIMSIFFQFSFTLLLVMKVSGIHIEEEGFNEKPV
jgi:hypothetical protein